MLVLSSFETRLIIGLDKMKITELTDKLRQKYTKSRGFGVVKIDEDEWDNIYFVVPPEPPKKLSGNLPYALIGDALKVIGALPHYSQMSELDKLINYLFVRREVVQSSRLEGTWSTIDHVLTPGEIADSNEGKSEHQAIRSYANLLEDIIKQSIDKREKIFTLKFIRELQKRIVENDPNSQGIPGKLRTPNQPESIVMIGGSLRKENSIYNPAPASEVKRCLGEVLEWYKDDEMAQRGDAGAGLSLPVRLAVGHSHFEAVHPFTDGNGRAGRALWPIQMICFGHTPLYLSGYIEDKKDKYGAALGEAQKKLNYIPLIKFICNAIIESDLEAKKTKETIRTLESRWQERGKFRDKSAPRRALKLLLTNPIISSSFLESELGISKTASVDAVNSLRKKKIIKFRRLENRKRIYAAEELIAILSRPFGSDIDIALEKAEISLSESNE